MRLKTKFHLRPRIQIYPDWPCPGPLLSAVRNGHEAVVKLLLEAGADPNHEDNQLQSPLVLAARANRESMLKLLLKAGVNPNGKCPNGFASLSALMIAASRGNERIVDLVLASGADAKARTARLPRSGITPIFQATTIGHVSIVRKLLQKGAALDICIPSRIDHQSIRLTQETLLHLATTKGHVSLIRLLLEQELDINQLSTFTRAVKARRMHGYDINYPRILTEEAKSLVLYAEHPTSPITST